ncbi:MAG: 16S rRNA (guanine(527)-N(7))-methyltransferase RsmG [Prevotella sp.]|nr:16S rRNA (guanine(527)-N(7))-methyltransferase RsmG [Prevotella sp.]
MQHIQKYFPSLTDTQQAQFAALAGLYREWNAKINVISRKDIDNLYLHHVLHSLAIAKAVGFQSGQRILDFGTGGGFPGIPLAIMFPECRFRLIDGTGKKIKVAGEIAAAIGLRNVEAIHQRGEDERGRYHYVVSRAVMPLPDLMRIARKNILPGGSLICLKGGDLAEELRPFNKTAKVIPVSNYFEEEWFKEKNVIEINCKQK